MSESPNEFAILMQRFQEGSSEAAQELEQKYGPALLMTVRRQLSKELRRRFDSRDFVQDAWVGIIANLADGRTFDRPESLGKFLVEMVRNKVIDAYRQRTRTLKYSAHREQSLNDSRLFGKTPILAADPTPSTVLMRKEEWDRLLERQPPAYRKVLLLLREGMPQNLIARELGMSEKTVRRVIDKVLPGTRP